ncbi:MAG TPA: hypothetical protein VKV15_15870 [Bryobacteraceae bacterium]|nr:hypothetical protein [Bryobacteraceae bacterium]
MRPNLTMDLDAFKQGRCRFVVATLAAGKFCFGGNELATERLGDDGLGELVGAFRCCLYSLFDFVSEFEKDFDAAGDFASLFQTGKWNLELAKLFLSKITPLPEMPVFVPSSSLSSSGEFSTSSM